MKTGKRSNIIVCLVCFLVVFVIFKSARAQNIMEESPSVIQIQPLPGIIAGPLIMNNGIVWPLENLNSFENSTLMDGGTTLGKRIERKSNIEVNQPRRDKAEGPQTEAESDEEIAQTQVEEYGPSFTPLSPSFKTLIYTWTDEDGVRHFTNDLKSIPPGYKNRVTKISEE